MSLFKRGKVWWYEFWFAGRRIRESAKTGSKTVAKGAEQQRNALDHFDYVRKLVGVEHLAIGSDLDVVGNGNAIGRASTQNSQPNFDRYGYHADKPGHVAVTGLDHPKRIFDLTDGLIGRGYTDADIRGVLGGNAVRALGAIWPY